jgi:hypothetical protein
LRGKIGSFEVEFSRTDMTEIREQSDTAATDGWSTPDQTAHAERFLGT